MAAKTAENPDDGNVIAFPGAAPTADEPLTERAMRRYLRNDAEPSGALRDLVEGRWPS